MIQRIPTEVMEKNNDKDVLARMMTREYVLGQRQQGTCGDNGKGVSVRATTGGYVRR